MRHLVIPSLASLGLLASLASCASDPPRPPVTPTTTSASAPSTFTGPCPLGVEGARVEAIDTPSGVSLRFASPDRVAELRARARDAARMYGVGSFRGAGHGGHHGEGGEHGLQPLQLPMSSAVAWDVDGGARIDLVPDDPADIHRLRIKAHERVEAMMASCH